MTRTLMLCLAVILMANPAFCSERRGFVLGFDIGPSLSYLHGEDSEGSSYDETNLGMGFDFRIGWAPRNRFSIHYNHKGAVFLGKMGSRELSSEQKLLGVLLLPLLPFTIGQNNAGIGATYYFQPQAPSFFVDGQLGFSIYPLEGFLELSGGPGFSIGCGYEFATHWNVLGSAMIGLSENGSEEKSSALSIIMTIGYLLY